MTQPPEIGIADRTDIVRLLRQRLGEDISYDDFRVAVEKLYNFRLTPESLPEDELNAIEELFDAVVWYSPFPEERAQIPHYKDEAEVDAAVEKARRAFRIA